MTDLAGSGRREALMAESATGLLGGLHAPRVRRHFWTPREQATTQSSLVVVPRKRARWDVSYRHWAVAADFTAALVTGVITAIVMEPKVQLSGRLAVLLALPVLWILALLATHGYERRYLGTSPEEYRAVSRAVVIIVGGLALVSYAAKLSVPRSLLLFGTPLLFLLGLTARYVVRRRLSRRRAMGLDTQPTVIIGNARSVVPMIREIKRAPDQGLHVVAACVSGLDLSGDTPSEVEGVPVFGYPEEAMSAVDLFDAEVVAVSSDPDVHGTELRRLAWSLEEREVDLVVSPGLLGVAGPRLSIRPTAGMPLLHVERPVMSGARRAFKTAAESMLTLLLVSCALPVMLVIAAAIRLDSRGPVLFRQKRVGAGGNEFNMIKFRTMCVDAEARLAELQRDAGNDVLFKMKEDPRITRVGKVLRRFSLDELPQLINVLRGEMSLVGPRPPLRREVEGYEPDAVRRLRVKPGLTGLWQVSGRSDLSWDESLRLDLWYVDNWSLVLDLQILFRTARAVVRGSGAY